MITYQDLPDRVLGYDSPDVIITEALSEEEWQSDRITEVDLMGPCPVPWPKCHPGGCSACGGSGQIVVRTLGPVTRLWATRALVVLWLCWASYYLASSLSVAKSEHMILASVWYVFGPWASAGFVWGWKTGRKH